MSKYPKLQDEEVCEFDMDNEYLRFACCDCGLVHTFAIFIVDKKPRTMGFACKRERRATAQLRRHKYGFLQRPVKGDRYKMVKTRS